jgi:ankyrin repeat protein
MTKMLLEGKCNVNLHNPHTWDTALHYAMRGKARETARLLLAHGANENAFNIPDVPESPEDHAHNWECVQLDPCKNEWRCATCGKRG